MAREVRKYEVHYGEARCYLPKTAQTLHVGVQRTGPQTEAVFVWALVDLDDVQPVARQMGYFATGEPIPDDAIFVGTAVSIDTAFVWHVFEGPGL